MSRRPLVAGNWKMNKTVPESIELARGVRSGNDVPPEDVEVCLLPPFTSLWPLQSELDGSQIGLGAQDMHWEEAGAFTGEISALMLSGWCRYALVGHSERRRLFGETDQSVNAKARAALAHGLRAMIAVGETLEEHEAGRTDAVLSRQVPAAVEGLGAGDAAQVVFAYEPVWAIGTGRTATPEHAQQSCARIRELLGTALGADAAAAIRVLYGGSVTPANARELMAQADVDGALVGGASLVAEDFLAIVRAAKP